MFVGNNALTDITLYNKIDLGQSNGKYERTVIKDVFWAGVKQKNVLKTGLTSSDSIFIQVPLSSLDGYTTPKEFYKAEDRTGKFTFAEQDIIIKGTIEDVMEGDTGKDLSIFAKKLKEYDNCVTVSVVDVNLFGSPMVQHIQLSCK